MGSLEEPMLNSPDPFTNHPASDHDEEEDAVGCMDHFLAGPISCSLLVMAHIMTGAAIFSAMDDTMGYSKAFYFAVVSFCTIGYGDVHPDSTLSKLYFIFYIIFGCLLQAAVAGTIISAIIDFNHDVMKQVDPANEYHFPGLNKVGAPSCSSVPSNARIRQEQLSLYLSIWPGVKSLMMATVWLLLIIAGGAVLLRESQHNNWIDSIYWAVVTLTTVGYGDITPSKHLVIFGFYFLVGVLMFTYVLGQIVSIFLEVQRFRRLGRFFNKGFTKHMLKKMDILEDKQVTLAEFTRYMLLELQLVDVGYLDRINAIFDALDTTHDGRLNRRDALLTLSSLPEL